MPRKLIQKRNERILLKNLLGILNRIERRDAKVSGEHDERDFRTQTMFFNTGLAGVTAAVNKLRLHATTKLEATV